MSCGRLRDQEKVWMPEFCGYFGDIGIRMGAKFNNIDSELTNNYKFPTGNK